MLNYQRVVFYPENPHSLIPNSPKSPPHLAAAPAHSSYLHQQQNCPRSQPWRLDDGESMVIEW